MESRDDLHRRILCVKLFVRLYLVILVERILKRLIVKPSVKGTVVFCGRSRRNELTLCRVFCLPEVIVYVKLYLIFRYGQRLPASVNGNAAAGRIGTQCVRGERNVSRKIPAIKIKSGFLG